MAITVTAEQLATIKDEELRYPVTIGWSDEDGCYIAQAPDLPGCLADGPTYEAAAAWEAMRIWLYVAREEGWTIPRPSVASAAA